MKIFLNLAQFEIKTGILYSDAKNGNEFELAKLAFLLLVNGLNESSEPILAAANKLPHNQYELINVYYYMYDKEHNDTLLSAANLSMCIIEKFLCLTSQNRKQIIKDLSNTPLKSSPLKKTDNNSKTDEADPKEIQIRIIFLRVGDIDTLNEKFFAEILGKFI